MKKIDLKKLSIDDDIDIFNMLKRIPFEENHFTNPVKKMDFDEFKKWLIIQNNNSKGIDLPKGYVKQSIYWFYVEDSPIGIGKIRYELTDKTRVNGGTIGFAIDSNERGKGYGAILLRLLIEETKRLNISEIITTVEKTNIPSRKANESNGGVLYDENDVWCYYRYE